MDGKGEILSEAMVPFSWKNVRRTLISHNPFVLRALSHVQLTLRRVYAFIGWSVW